MKKLLIGIIVSGCSVLAFAQEEKLLQLSVHGGGEIINKAQSATEQGIRAADDVARSLENALNAAHASGPIMEVLSLPADHTLAPQTPSVPWQLETSPQQVAQLANPVVSQARLPGLNQLHEKIFPAADQIYVPVSFAQDETSFVYRGLKLARPEDIKNILLNGMEVGKSSFLGQVFATPSLRLALNYALQSKHDILAAQRGERQIPVIVRIRLTQELADKVPAGVAGFKHVFYQTVPAKDLTDVMVFLEMNGKQTWHKASLHNGEMVLRPVPSQNVKVGDDLFIVKGQTANTHAPGALSVRTFDPYQLRAKVFPQEDKMYVPHMLRTDTAASVYRGMQLNPKEIKNILINGLETDKGEFLGEVFTSPSVRMALSYAAPSPYFFTAKGAEVQIPVLVKIHLTQELLEKVRFVNRGMEWIFYQTVPAAYLTDVMVFLEVNGQAEWYKVVLKNGKMVLSLLESEVMQDDFFVQPKQIAFTAQTKDLSVSQRIMPSEKPVSATAANLRVLPDEKLRQAISNDDEMRLSVPQTFVQADNTFYRGLRLKNTAELQNILEKGMEVGKTHHDLIYVSPNVSVAMGYMFPSQTARLLGTHEGEVALPVLVKIPVTERLLEENPPLKPEGEFGGRRVLHNDIPADMITEVAVYAEINGVQGWYQATLENGQLVFTPIPIKKIPGWIAE